MSIEFIRDEFLENKKEELDDIEKVLSTKHKKPDRNVIFLRRFTLALLGQYKFKTKIKHDEIEILNRHIIHETKKMHDFKRPLQIASQQLHVPTPQRLSVPIPLQYVEVPKPKDKIPTPI